MKAFRIINDFVKLRVGFETTLNFEDSENALTTTVANRIKNVADYGYDLTPVQRKRLSDVLNYFQAALGKVPAFLYDAEVSWNRNIIGSSEDISNAVWTKVGTATTPNANTLNMPAASDGILQQITTGYSNANTTAHISCVLSGTGTVRIGVRDGGAGTAYSTEITLTATPTRYTFNQTFAPTDTQTAIGFFIRRLSGATATTVTVAQIACGKGNYTTYNQRIGVTAVKPLNLGTASALGDGTLVNGTSGSMMDILNGLVVFRNNSGSSQYITTSISGTTAGLPRNLHVFINRITAVNSAVMNFGGAANPITAIRAYRSTSTPPQPSVSINGIVAPDFSLGDTDPGDNIWFELGLNFSSSLLRGFINGSNNGGGSSAAITDTDHSEVTLELGRNQTLGTYNGFYQFPWYDPSSFSDAQLNNLFIYLKSYVGL